MSKVFFEKFNEWKKITSSCPAFKRSQPVDFCMYNGKPCCFVTCPRRIFERELKVEGYVPVEDRIEKLRGDITSLKDDVQTLRLSIDHIKDVVDKLTVEQ